MGSVEKGAVKMAIEAHLSTAATMLKFAIFASNH